MSQITLQQPIQHIPSFKRWGVPQGYLVHELHKVSVEPIIETDDFVLDRLYYYTNMEGWSKVLPDLLLRSGLYRENIFDCEDYALKAQIECALRYGLNAMRLCIGRIPQGMHGFDIFPYGNERGIEGFMLFEPNDGFEWAGNAFDIGENGYQPLYVFLVGRR